MSRDFTHLGRRYFPELKAILSTWMFDTPPEGEWEGLAECIDENLDWIGAVMADSHEDFPHYPLMAGVPGGLPLINFPEISMWGNTPWCGVGANPLPSRFQRLWNQVKDSVDGGFPYSEGLYEDMNKAMLLQFYWNREQTVQTTLEEYIAYEFNPLVTKGCCYPGNQPGKNSGPVLSETTGGFIEDSHCIFASQDVPMWQDYPDIPWDMPECAERVNKSQL